ncbi:MAG: tetratricopeptide repeat protein [Desulfobacteraceae bacterium]|nr:MAG: tetratricopeptide repeat protein [Desulfobacteraceae bacterium]
MKTSQTTIIILLGLAVVTLAVYWQVHEFEFISFDDDIYVYENEHVKNGFTDDALLWALNPVSSDGAYWHPLTWLSHMIDVELFSLNAGAHHLVNLLFHVVNVLLLFLALQLMTGEAGKSAFAAALFALHPINVDTVAWVAERKNLLSTTFWMLTMLAYIRYARKPNIVRYLLVFSTLALGLLAKPMLVTLPCVFLLMDFWPLGRIRWSQTLPISPVADIYHPFQWHGIIRLGLEKVPLFALAFICIGLSLISLQSGDAAAGPATGPPLLLRWENAIVSYAVYLWKLVWPVNLAFYYPFPASIPAWQTTASCLLIVIVTVAAFHRIHKTPYLAMGWFWYIGTLVPVLGLIQGGLWPAMADRWAYVPFIGLYIIIAWGSADLLAAWGFNKKAIIFPAAALLCLISFLSFRQAGHWRNNRSLYSHAITATDNNFVAYNNLGNVCQAEGQTEAAIREYKKSLESNPVYTIAMFNLGVVMYAEKRYEEAIRYLSQALKLDPDYADAHNTLGQILIATGRPEEAIPHFLASIAIKPDNEKAHNTLSALLTGLGRYDEAVSHARQAMHIQPDYAEAYFNLGTALSRNGKMPEAIPYFLKAVEIQPEMADAHISIANAYYALGKPDPAITHYRKTLEIDISSAYAHTNLANALGAKGQSDEAIAHYRKAIAINPNVPETYNNLGVALVRKGDIAQAARCFQAALTLKPGYESALNNLKQLGPNVAPLP